MVFPKKQTLARALRLWREARRLGPSDVVRASRSYSKSPFDKGAIQGWESGKSSPTCERFVEDICPAYEIRDLDVFLDFARLCEDGFCEEELDGSRLVLKQKALDEIVVVKKRTDQAIFDVNVKFSAPGTLGRNRSRIDEMTLPAGHRTTWNAHGGHEYLMVLAGKVRCFFGLMDNRKEEPDDHCELSAGEAVAFPSVIFHAVENIGTETATILVARPAAVDILKADHEF